MKSQEQHLLAHLKRGRSVTSVEALNRWGVFRLAARVLALKQAGYQIVRTTEHRNGKHYARYRLVA